MKRSAPSPDGAVTRRRSIRASVAARVALALALVAPVSAASQVRPSAEGGRTASLGQPGPWNFHLGVDIGTRLGETGGTTAHGSAGVCRTLGNPLVPLLAACVEGYAGVAGSESDFGFRPAIDFPYLRVRGGLDYDVSDDRADFFVSVVHPIRRGGIFGYGTRVVLDYMPTRDHEVSVGIEMPVGQRLQHGQTRPRHSAVRLPAARSRSGAPPAHQPGMEEVLAELEESAVWLGRLIVPSFDQASAWDGQAAAEAFLDDVRALEHRLGENGGRGVEGEVRRYHDEMDRAFSMAVSGRSLARGTSTPEGRAVAARAREVLLDEVLLPYDRLLGLRKEDDTVLGLGRRAETAFVRWLHTGSRVPDERVDAAVQVFDGIVDAVEAVRQDARRRWEDSRFVWLPLQLALRPEEHDSQAELDALVERAVERPFTEGNDVSYLVNEQFHFELCRMIHAARDYHVLWIHDVRGYDDLGEPDQISYSQVRYGYLQALVDRVREYDETGALPVYMIFLDQWFYELRGSRLWMDLLEDPMGHRLELPEGFEEWEREIASVQEELRDAVEASRLLQAEAERFGQDWLRNRIRIHVNITNRSDLSFWSQEVMPVFGLPDNVMRDHRKIAFYDITEENPYRGAVLYTGMGVGEHYTNLRWEDRSIRIRGPAALTVKTAARELLLMQGIPEEQIPHPLQPRPLPEGFGRGWPRTEPILSARAMEVHNETGYGAKRVTVVKAILYSLMPAGSVMKAPDSLWNSSFWASMLTGAALRGARVLVIAPAARNAPSAQFPQLSRSQEVLTRLIVAQEVLGDEIAAAGGMLKTGLYATDIEVTDIEAKVAGVLEALERYPFLRELYAFDPSVIEAAARVRAGLQDQNDQWERGGMSYDDNGVPKLHLKGNFFASREAWEGLISRPEWAGYLASFVGVRVAQIEGRQAMLIPGTETPSRLEPDLHMITGWREELHPSTEGRCVLYLVMGSANQNTRSMVMDGEVAVVLAGWESVAALIDFISIVGLTTWVDDLETLDELLPEHDPAKRWIGQWLRLAL